MKKIPTILMFFILLMSFMSCVDDSNVVQTESLYQYITVFNIVNNSSSEKNFTISSVTI